MNKKSCVKKTKGGKSRRKNKKLGAQIWVNPNSVDGRRRLK